MGRCLLALALFAAGCGPDGPPRGEVGGRVTVGGEALSGATIVFEDAKSGVALTATLGAGGEYTVQTYKDKGLPVGTYKVAVTPGTMLSSDNEIPLAGKKGVPPRPTPTVKIPAKYNSVSTSGLSAEVEEGKNAPFNYDLVK